MREVPSLWPGPRRIQWACVLAEELGLEKLDDVPLLMQGLASVLKAPAVAPHAALVREARHVLQGVRSHGALVYEVRDFNAFVREQGRQQAPAYEIQERDDGIHFKRVTHRIKDRDVTANTTAEQARQALRDGFDRQFNTLSLADPAREFTAEVSARRTDGYAATGTVHVPVNLGGVPLPAIPQHSLDRTPRGALRVPWSDLEAIAAELDRLDGEQGHRPENWAARLANAKLMVTAGGKLEPGTELVLEGLKHLVGLPGAGKTTLITLLCVWLSRQGVKTAVFFTSVQVARGYLEKLHRYGASVGMLVGQGGTTRARHATRLSELAASGDPQGGFGHAVFGAHLFGANCLLPAFAPSGSEHWPLGEAPCDRVQQRREPGDRRAVRRLCPAWAACGRNKAARDLPSQTVWLGHIASLDTLVPGHTSEERLRYFELVARTFDVVIVDECDAAQQNLDGHGAVTLKITGRENSLHHNGVQDLQVRLAGEDNFMLTDPLVEVYDEYFDRFSWHTKRLVTTVQKLSPETRERYAGQLLTTNAVLSRIMRDIAQERKAAVWDFYQSALYDAFETDNRPQEWVNARRFARDLGLKVTAARKEWLALNEALRMYLRANTSGRREAAQAAIHRILVRVVGLEGRPVHEDVRLLVAVSCLVVAFRRVAGHAQRLVTHGIVDGSVLSNSDSAELQKHVPVNVMGLLSGVRFHMQPNGSTAIDYLMMNSAPRLLLYHLHELDGEGGPAVLLTSATSYLEQSTTYHVEVLPDYVLSPAVPDVRADLTHYAFTPVTDQRSGTPLSFSGAGDPHTARENLRRMVDALVGGDWQESEVGKALTTLQASYGARRKAAFVVNSYEQVETIVEHLRVRHPDAYRRVRGVVRAPRPGPYVTSAQVEALRDDEDVELLVFPMMAIGRGVNIVFSEGEHRRKAAMGCLYFLTRPHPAADDLSFLLSVVARETQKADARVPAGDETLEETRDAWLQARRAAFARASELIGSPLRASTLEGELFEAFAANLAVPVLQTIGRGMRGGSPVQVFFVDAAWARMSARGEVETASSSVLVAMRDVLRACVNHPDPLRAGVYRELYAAFLDPLERLENLHFPDPAVPRPAPRRKAVQLDPDDVDDVYVPPADLDLEEI
ncbi:hypothetical protein Dcar01_01774 [Deinococcus carri]|uniref:DNA helicase n=1 Tax=Deinococcus carri TaxID=1211323 RepID=A0ABP9W939_9DEIO